MFREWPLTERSPSLPRCTAARPLRAHSDGCRGQNEFPLSQTLHLKAKGASEAASFGSRLSHMIASYHSLTKRQLPSIRIFAKIRVPSELRRSLNLQAYTGAVFHCDLASAISIGGFEVITKLILYFSISVPDYVFSTALGMNPRSSTPNIELFLCLLYRQVDGTR